MDAEEKWGVRGIVSFGHPQCNIGKPGVYTNVQQHIEWIKDTMKKLFSSSQFLNKIEMFYLNSTLNFGIPRVLVFQLEVYYNVDRLLTGLTAQQKGTTARLYSNKNISTHEISENGKICI